LIESVSVDAQEIERARRRVRHQTIIYDPQLCPASKWQSDEVIHVSPVKPAATEKTSSAIKIHYEEEQSCAFCQGSVSIPICCFCACRVCFRKKDKVSSMM